MMPSTCCLESSARRLEVSDDYRSDPEAIAKLDDLRFVVTQIGVTEPSFDNEFWD